MEDALRMPVDWRESRRAWSGDGSAETLPELSDDLAAALLAAVDCPLPEAADADADADADAAPPPPLDLVAKPAARIQAKTPTKAAAAPAVETRSECSISSSSPSSMSDAVARELKRKLANQRKYSKKQARRRALQEQAAALEKQMQALSAASGAQVSSAAVRDLLRSLAAGALHPPAPSGRGEREALLRTAVRAKMLLKEENAALRRQFMASTQLHLRLGDLLFAEHTLCMAHASYFAILKPLTPERCLQKHAEVESVVTSVTGLSSARSPSASGMGSVCGWREDRAVEGSKFRFLLRKTFRHCRARDVCDQTFAFLLDPAVLSRFYSESLSVRLRIMQRVDDDNVVFFEELVLVDTPAMRVVSKSILLMSRIPIADGGFRICMRCLDADEMPMKVRGEDEAGATTAQPAAPINGAVEEMWKSRIWWIQIDQDGEEDCVVSYAGIVPISGSTAWFLMGEVLVNAIRWELKMKGSPFGLRV